MTKKKATAVRPGKFSNLQFQVVSFKRIHFQSSLDSHWRFQKLKKMVSPAKEDPLPPRGLQCSVNPFDTSLTFLRFLGEVIFAFMCISYVRKNLANGASKGIG